MKNLIVYNTKKASVRFSFTEQQT